VLLISKNMLLDRVSIAELIFNNLNTNFEKLKNQFKNSNQHISYFYLDDLLPDELVLKIYSSFPKYQETTLKKSLKQHKHIAVQMNQYDPLLEEVIYAFQELKVIKIIEQICGFQNLIPDTNLYAGGISMMRKNNFLNPHLDNSHDKDRNLWRVLNLLYYVTPNWKEENGGNLELWPKGPSNDNITIHSKFNRLVIMVTHNQSWHSVSKIKVSDIRCCVPNYYFSRVPVHENSKFHVTTFRGRPEQKIRNMWLKIDSFTRMQIRKIFKKGIIENPHQYKK